MIFHELDVKCVPLTFPLVLDRKPQSRCQSIDNKIPNANFSTRVENIFQLTFKTKNTQNWSNSVLFVEGQKIVLHRMIIINKRHSAFHDVENKNTKTPTYEEKYEFQPERAMRYLHKNLFKKFDPGKFVGGDWP